MNKLLLFSIFVSLLKGYSAGASLELGTEPIPDIDNGITTTTQAPPSIFIDLFTSSRNRGNGTYAAETVQDEANRPIPYIRRSEEIPNKPPIGAFLLNFLKYNKPQMNKQGLIQKLLTERRHEPVSDLLVRKLMTMDRKPGTIESQPPQIFDIISQLRTVLTKLMSPIFFQLFKMLLERQDNVLETLKNVVLTLLTKVDSYLLEMIKNFIFKYMMGYQDNFLEGMKNKALQFIAKQEMNAFNKVKDGTQHVLADQKDHLFGGVKRNIFNWMQVPPMLQMFL